MPDLFWRRRLRKQANKIILELPNLPDDIDDNVFIAIASQAAEQDKKSGAYDEFMFSEDGYVSMPFEDSVDEFLSLQIARTSERKGRAELPFRLRLEYLKSRVEYRKKQTEDAAADLEEAEKLSEEISDHLYKQSDVDTQRKEKDTKDVSSKTRHVRKLFTGWLIFVIVAGIDLGVVFYSLLQITPTFREAILFTIPAVGVQVLFPHLVGKAIAGIKREPHKKTQNVWIAILVGASWIFYIAAMTILRVQLLVDYYREKNLEKMPFWMQIAAGIFSVFILVGLGAWVMIRAMQENPDEAKFSRVRYKFFSTKGKYRKAMKRLAKAEADVAAEEKLLEAIIQQWDNRAAKYPELGESAKSAYRRALVNQQGTPDFTTTYLPKEKFKLRSNRRD